jgi:hypothetical protein
LAHFTLQITQQGAILNIVIGISEGRRKALESLNLNSPDPIQISAIIDTGASGTCIESSVLKKLHLTPTGSTQMSTPSTGGKTVDIDLYDVSIIIPPGKDGDLPFSLGTLPVMCVADNSFPGYKALIGRDILRHCIFNYNGSINLYSLAF